LAASGATPQQARLIGFDLATMRTVKQCLPRYHCSLVTRQGSDAAATAAFVHAAADAGMDSVDLEADPATVRALHQRKLVDGFLHVPGACRHFETTQNHIPVVF
jgi:hypothetical protein